MRKLLLAVALCAPCLPNAAFAQDSVTLDGQKPGWYLQGGAYIHYTDDEDYEGPPLFAGVEYVKSDKWRYGVSMFQNSFGQFSQNDVSEFVRPVFAVRLRGTNVSPARKTP